MPHFKRPVPQMGANLGKMAITGTHNFIMERARAVGNIPAMRKAHAPSSGPGMKKSPMQGKSTKLATGGPANLRVAGLPFNKKSALPSTRGPVMKGQKVIARSPEAMARGAYKNRTLGAPEFGQYKGGTGKRGSA